MIDKTIVLIIGNGFDMDLGWKTSYKDFVNSKKWPFVNTSKGLGWWLNQKTNSENWYDLEALLRAYACLDEGGGIHFDKVLDKKQFLFLKKRIGEYLQKEENKQINRNSLASNLLWWLSGFWKNTKIYSFNYTDLAKIVSKNGKSDNSHCEYLHGELSKQSHILGIDDKANIRKGYEFLRKSSNHSYHSSNLLDDMRKAECIIFYGLCFGDIDYPYFRLFFQERCSEQLYKTNNAKKFICFFTKDEDSECLIKKNISEMNDHKMVEFFSFNEIAFFHETEKWQSSNEIDEYFNHKLSLHLNFV